MEYLWRAGMFCVCIDNTDSDGYIYTALEVGKVYTIREVLIDSGFINDTEVSDLSLKLIEIADYQDGNWFITSFWAKMFRPLQDDALDCFREHLVKKPVMTEIGA